MANNPVRQYIGARYVPLFATPLEWTNETSYEPLTIVLHEGNSYTSRQFVPTGIDITNDTFWALTGNYNAQIEQYRNEVKQFADAITTNTNNIDNLKKRFDVYVNDYAKSDGTTDDTTNIQNAINTAITNNARKIIFDGNYKVTRTATDSEGLYYSINIDGLRNCEIIFNNSYFTSIFSAFSNIFHLENCENITIHDGNCEFLNPDNTPGQLYSGAFIHIHKSKNITTQNIGTKNTFYAITAKNSHNIKITNTYYINNLTQTIGYSGILIHTTSKAIVTNNTIIGNLADGALSIYGSGTYDCIVSQNIVESVSKPTEGITIDAGTHNNIITNNYVANFNYGIDVKSLAQENIVSNNNIIHCRVGISDRPGEELGPTASNIISNNIITFGTPIESTFNPFGFIQVGILSENRDDSTINGNILTLENNYDNKNDICGILIQQQNTGTGSGSNRIITIKNNRIDFNILINATWNYASQNSPAIKIISAKNVLIHENTINVPETADNASIPIHIDGTNFVIDIKNNNVKMNKEKNFITLLNEATIIRPIIDYNIENIYVPFTHFEKYTSTEYDIFYINNLTANTPYTLANINTTNNVMVTIQGITTYPTLTYINTIQTINVNDMTEITMNKSTQLTLSYTNKKLQITSTIALTSLQLKIKLLTNKFTTVTLE